MTEPISYTPEEVEKAEYEIFQEQVRQRILALSTKPMGEPITLTTSGLGAERIMAMYRQQLISQQEAMKRIVNTELFDREYPTSPLEPITTKCPLCGEPSPENKTCVTCLDKYITESKEWLKKNER